MGAITNRSRVRTATPRRRFRLSDAMILLAATALGYGIIEGVVRAVGGFLSWSALYAALTAPRRHQPRAATLSRLALLTLPLVVTWTLALIEIRLLRPRPRFRRLTRQPGMMAACAAGAVIVFVGLVSFAFVMVLRWESHADYFRAVFFVGGLTVPFVPILCGLAVLVSWLTLLASRRWRAEPSWVDRLGRALGAVWIAAGFLTFYLYFNL